MIEKWYNRWLDVLTELGTRYFESSGAAAIWQKSSDVAAYRYLNEKVVALIAT